MSRRWVAADGPAFFSPGGMLANDGGPLTVGIIWKPITVRPSGLFRTFSGGNQVFAVNPFSDGNIYASLGAPFAVVSTYSAADGWRIDFMTHAPDANMFWHTYKYDTPGWVHTDEGQFFDSPTSGVNWDIRIANYTAGETLDGEIAVMGMWNSVLSDVSIEGLTSQLSAWMDLSPALLWAFDQDNNVDPVLDLTGNGANEVTKTGVVGASDPPGFNYSLDGATRFYRDGGLWVPVTRHVRQAGSWVTI